MTALKSLPEAAESKVKPEIFEYILDHFGDQDTSKTETFISKMRTSGQTIFDNNQFLAIIAILEGEKFRGKEYAETTLHQRFIAWKRQSPQKVAAVVILIQGHLQADIPMGPIGLVVYYIPQGLFQF